MIKDKWARIIGIPLISVIIPIIIDYDKMIVFDSTSLQHVIASLAFATAMWEGNRIIFFVMKEKFPGYQLTSKRIIVQTASSLLYTIIVATAISFVLSLVFLTYEFSRQHVYRDIFISIIPTLLVTSIYESVYFFQQWKQHIQRAEALAKENIQSQLEVLKSQVDPHFLFNSLNTLAALIDDTNEPAQKYLEQLSDVYRYVLVSKDKTTVTLEEELAFVESYIHLNKARFRNNLQVENLISKEYYKCLVAPLSLQMLIENAIKHNVISKDKPLTIKLFPEADNYITIQNNIQEKAVLEKSTKIGLQNIINRYGLLTSKKIQILNDKELFTVKIPLINYL